MRLIFVFLAICFVCSGQSYSLKNKTFNNGFESPMNGVPGDIFMNTLTFTNKNSQAVNVFFDRFENTLPPYWKLCYCYIQCHSPEDDTVTITIDPFSSTDISLQFKTDSVNPGLATASFKLLELGSNFTQTVNMQASTMGNVGLWEMDLGYSVLVFPNPAENRLNVTSKELISGISVYGITGTLLHQSTIKASRDYCLDIEGFKPGYYLIKIHTSQAIHSLRFIRTE